MKLSEQISVMQNRSYPESCEKLDYIHGFEDACNEAAMLAEAHELTWTKTLPTVVGWYWTRIGKSVEVDLVYEGPGHLSCNGMALIVMDGFLWAGPINQPKEGV